MNSVKHSGILFCIGILMSIFITNSEAQEIKYEDGIKIIYNDNPQWGKEQRVKLEHLRTIGGIDVESENKEFFEINGIVVDRERDIYILDSGNKRVQVFNIDGEFKRTIGRGGQGPSEFGYPVSIDIDKEENIHVFDQGNRNILKLNKKGKEVSRVIIEGRDIGIGSRILPPDKYIIASGMKISMLKNEVKFPDEWYSLHAIFNTKGKIEAYFGESVVIKRVMDNTAVIITNQVAPVEIDKQGMIYSAIAIKNKIEKWGKNGKPQWISKRKLPFSETEYVVDLSKGKMDSPNIISTGISIDSRNRIWVSTVKKTTGK